MSRLRSRGIVVTLKIYVAISLIITAVFSPLSLSFAPILLVIWYLYLWRWRPATVLSLLTDYFIFYAISILLAPVVGPFFSLLASLPVFVLVNNSLDESSELLTVRNTRYTRGPTSHFLALLWMSIMTLGISLIFGSFSLLLTCLTALIYLGILGTVVFHRFPLKLVEETQVQQRMVAGAEDSLRINLTPETRIGGLLFVESPYDWLKVSPDILSLKESKLALKISLSPVLSGPSIIKLKGHAIDRWGIIQTRFELQPVRLFVVPRARYAAWLARKYIAETRPGTLPMISNIGALKPIYGLRRGVEYYGNRPYQPGDSLKNVDWKHSVKYQEIVTKEFAEFQGQPALVLINLAVGDAEEADKLAYKIIITALSLARESIPTALAAYNHEQVKLVTTTLEPRLLLLKSLEIAREMVAFINPVKYLNPPDVTRLKADISRIRFVESEPSRALLRLLQIEYRNLDQNARHHPATKALAEAFARVDKQSNIVVISHRNHDAEALAFNTYNLTQKGNAVITI